MKGSKKGNSVVLIDGLPGLPDNLKADQQGNFYIALVMARDDENSPFIITHISKYPLLRKFVARFMGVLQTTFSVLDRFFPHTLLKKAVHAVSNSVARILLKRQI